MMFCSINVDWVSIWNNVFQPIPHTAQNKKNQFQMDCNINVRAKTMDLLHGIMG